MAEYGLGSRGFAKVCFIPQIVERRAKRESADFVTGMLDAFDLAPNEGMADRGIEVAQIG